jgi:hypothetical protein
MWRSLCAAGLAACLGGCVSGPLLENPLLVPLRPTPIHENPVYIPQHPMAYARIFETIEDVLSDYFVIDAAKSSRFDGQIVTLPAIAPGIEQPWKPGSPDFYQRLLAFTQTIRHRAIVEITTAKQEGFFVSVKILKELEDIPAPTGPTAGQATYRLESTVQRQFEVVYPQFFDTNWIPIGRDTKLEQVILDRISRMDVCKPTR